MLDRDQRRFEIGQLIRAHLRDALPDGNRPVPKLARRRRLPSIFSTRIFALMRVDPGSRTSLHRPLPGGRWTRCRVFSPSVVVFVRRVTVLGGRMAGVRLDPESTVRLLSAILWELPSLPAAACRGRSGLFDDHCDGETREQRRERLEAAVTVCQRCPELAVCERLPLPRGSGVGVVAGRVLAR